MSVSKYIEELSSKGRYYFTSAEAQSELKIKKASITVALSRLARNKKIKVIKRGFIIILKAQGSEPHPSFYIDALMNFIDTRYYVGLLSAASHWGASHQSSMKYQIVVDKPVFKITLKTTIFEFVVKKLTFEQKYIQKVSNIGGYINVSTPELTAVDIVRYYKKSGYLNNVATTLYDLKESWDGRKLSSLLLNPAIPTVTLQRLGYIFDVILIMPMEARYVEHALTKRSINNTVLLKNKNENEKMSDSPFDQKWKLYINTMIESDL